MAKPLILLGDFNGRSQFWGDCIQTYKGSIPTNYIIDMGLISFVPKSGFIFVKSNKRSKVDIINCDRSLGGFVRGKVPDALSASDHRYTTRCEIH